MAGMTQARQGICLKLAVVTGAAADTDIAITGLAADDQLVSVVEQDVATAMLTDRTATTSITSAGNIQCTVSTASDTLLVQYIDVSA